jgi:hypothetical protein
MKTTQEIADRLYELCSRNLFEQAQRELFANDAESIEQHETEGFQTVKGLDAIIAKGDQFQAAVEEMHGGYVNVPLVFGNNIFMEMGMDVTMKGAPRMDMAEMCHYLVKDGKIVSETFYY